MGRPRQFDEEAAVESAMRVFWRKGYGATTPQDLVDELGIGKGSLYNAFGSRRALFERSLQPTYGAVHARTRSRRGDLVRAGARPSGE